MARAMKDSGIPWIGKIPENWSTTKIKHHFDIIAGATPKSEQPKYWDGQISWITPADYKTQDKYVSHGRKYLTKEGYDSCGTTIVPANSIIFSKRAPVGTVAITANELCTNQGCLSCVIRNNQDTDAVYYYYAMSSFTEQFELVSTGTTFKEIAADVFANFFLPRPPYSIQRNIAVFLDFECARIDAVMEQTRASIEEYKKLKQSIITEAVTKGIRPNRPMKDSGIDWIGTIPKEWKVRPLKNIISLIESGVSVNAAQHAANEAEIGVLKTSCVSKFVFIPSENKAVDADELARVSCPVKANTLIVSRMNTPDLVGACGYVEKDYFNLFLPDRLWQVHFSDGISVKYIWYYMNNRQIRSYYGSLAVGTSSSMQNISQDQFYNTLALMPDREEQNEIVCYLDRYIGEIDSAIRHKENLCSEMEAYKKSLIFEYVTGKKEVNA